MSAKSTFVSPPSDRTLPDGRAVILGDVVHGGAADTQILALPLPPVEQYDRALCQGALGPCGLPCIPGGMLCEGCRAAAYQWELEAEGREMDERVERRTRGFDALTKVLFALFLVILAVLVIDTLMYP